MKIFTIMLVLLKNGHPILTNIGSNIDDLIQDDEVIDWLLFRNDVMIEEVKNAVKLLSKWNGREIIDATDRAPEKISKERRIEMIANEKED